MDNEKTLENRIEEPAANPIDDVNQIINDIKNSLTELSNKADIYILNYNEYIDTNIKDSKILKEKMKDIIRAVMRE